MAGKAILTCRPNSHLFQERTLILERPVKIGRSVARARPAPNNAIFDCKVLSRNHALFWYTNGKFYLQDTKSSNGTFVNNQRLSKSGEESLPREVCSGDTVQFGVDVTENTRKVTHGCIIASLKLYLPDGKEAKPSSTCSTPQAGSIPVEDLYELHQYLQEATQRELMLETKLFALQEVLNSIREAADQGWKALIAEDRLLTRVEALENQLQAYSKNFGDDKLKEEVAKLQEEKNEYQVTAKEFLKKVLDEKLEAVQKCQEVKRTLVSVEAAYASLTEEMSKSQTSIQDLAQKLSLQLMKNEVVELKLQELEQKHKETVERLENRNKELEKMLALHHATEESFEKQLLSDLRTAESIANEKALAFEIQLKALNNISGDKDVMDFAGDVGDNKRISSTLLNENKDNEVQELLTAQLDLLQSVERTRLPQIIEDQKVVSDESLKQDLLNDSIVPVNSEPVSLDSAVENEKETVNGALSNASDWKIADDPVEKENANETESSEASDVTLKERFDASSENLKLLDGCVISNDKSDIPLKTLEEKENSLTSQVPVEQIKLLTQEKLENLELDDSFKINQNKKNQDHEDSLLKRQLLEAEQSVKQSKNEQAHLVDRIIALTAELEAKNLSDDNKIREKLFETQQECSNLQRTVFTLQAELISLNENLNKIEDEKNSLKQKFVSDPEGEDSETDMSKTKSEALAAKVSQLQEDLLIVNSKYMACNEERAKISKELSNLRLDYQAISHQPYFNLFFALPCIVLLLAITIAFYPTLSNIMGTSERNERQ